MLPNSAITPESTALLERVRQAKRLNKLSVETIANAAGMHRPTVQNQLYGRYNLDIRVVLAVARLCPNISCNWLLRAEGNMLLDASEPNREQPQETKKTDINLQQIADRLEKIEQMLIKTRKYQKFVTLQTKS